ncbi:MAG: alpha-glucan family phosphorylase [Bacteroidetes bacterium]|nr:alpha-glucan family phosphorylase [Rhodothermia bacterium]MCX7907517.1 alpha-glucan family phosphorylase [Bacteroidota bacterium]MDW8284552.1 alpha-glucan family phosphorylase [Bacteroidota bacterium]
MSWTVEQTRARLRELAYNLWWSWHPEAQALFEALHPVLWESSGHNPVAVWRALDESLLRERLASEAFREHLRTVYERFRSYMEEPSRNGHNQGLVAYFCMEFALHESLPQYAGGLGVLAGDHLKSASDLGLPLVGVGIFWREGYFTQRFSPDGWQQECYERIDPYRGPLVPLTHPDGPPVIVSVPLDGRRVWLRAWKVQVGRVPLYLLDADFDSNAESDRALTRRLYADGPELRIRQEALLGIGGVRLLRALGLKPDVFHLNEGHCAFLTLELLREARAQGLELEEAWDQVRARCVFTTHTPVDAGHDRFPAELVERVLGGYRIELGLSQDQLLALGRVNTGDSHEPLCMTVLALKGSRWANGVSRLHGEVSRHMWQSLYPGRPVQEVPIGYITNGVHLATWAASEAQAFLSRHLGPDWEAHQVDPAFWSRIDEISDEALWAYRNRLRLRLLAFVREYVRAQSLPFPPLLLNAEALTIGFARRFAPYKRATLLFRYPDRLARLLGDPDRPVQILFAGKAHPRDDWGKRLLQEIYHMAQRPEFAGKIVLLENYDLYVARMLVSGCDLWLNTPRRPFEASGTSGMKVVLHAGLQASVLDGWWCEGFNGRNGWAIGDGPEERDPQQQDERDAEALYELLETEIIPAFFERDALGLPRRWLARIREAWKSLLPVFNTHRMLLAYQEQAYSALPSSVRT